jgi:hypothetical protein
MRGRGMAPTRPAYSVGWATRMPVHRSPLGFCVDQGSRNCAAPHCVAVAGEDEEDSPPPCVEPHAVGLPASSAPPHRDYVP